ncbi:MAG: putative iron export permease protein FetB [Syntrophomonadaceae bacterium]|nr:putative iron export permease protein FetB [Bacillota bacterium]
MQEINNLPIWQLVAAYLFILVLLAIIKIKEIPREKEITLATVRMTLQLVLTGYLLVFLFEYRHPVLSVLAVLLMLAFAVDNTIKRVRILLSRQLKKVIALSMTAGTITCLLFFVLVVINLSPWYEPRYFIPIAGMLIGNSMTGISLGVSRLAEGMRTQKALVETALMLGATPRAAAKTIVNSAFDAAILPTINSMVGMGIVFLPGMMTGQILAGASPVTAIQYQIAIMLGITGSVALTVILLVQLGYKTFFNEEQQLTV